MVVPIHESIYGIQPWQRVKWPGAHLERLGMVPVRFTYRNYSFLTQIADTFMDFAICASVMPPFLFFLTIQFI